MAEEIENIESDDRELSTAMQELQRAQERVAQLREQNRKKVIADVTGKIKMYDLKPKELGFRGPLLNVEDAGVDRRSKVTPKYRSPDGQNSWSGRGNPPRWLRQFLDAGAKKEDFEVDKSDRSAQ